MRCVNVQGFTGEADSSCLQHQVWDAEGRLCPADPRDRLEGPGPGAHSVVCQSVAVAVGWQVCPGSQQTASEVEVTSGALCKKQKQALHLPFPSFHPGSKPERWCHSQSGWVFCFRLFSSHTQNSAIQLSHVFLTWTPAVNCHRYLIKMTLRLASGDQRIWSYPHGHEREMELALRVHMFSVSLLLGRGSS